ncbi:hypothetical protein [Streptomyces sp. NPDC008139]|uniref:hypothetical protein n=1 Tax=Streptomyces sp. NPDC008139 TaxID=3364814 RepID=UPI0036E190F1
MWTHTVQGSAAERTYPYASELFGVYQTLRGWLGYGATSRLGAALGADLDRALFSGPAAGELTVGKADSAPLSLPAPPIEGILSPVGLINLFRAYFFEFDTFLGTPVGHLWLSPGGTVEVVETATRRTLVERTAEQSETSTHKTEESLTDQTDVADAARRRTRTRRRSECRRTPEAGAVLVITEPNGATGAARCADWSARAAPSCRRRRPARPCPPTARSRRSARR